MVTNIERKGEFIVVFEESSYSDSIYEEWLNLYQIVSVKFFKEYKPDQSKEVIYCTEIVMTNGTNKTYKIPEALYEQLKTILNLHHHNGKSFF